MNKQFTNKQFSIVDHYDMMAQLDKDVHENVELSRSEVELALKYIGTIPQSVFIPCFGTGRHIPYFLENGVKKITGVDLSPKCVEKARKMECCDSRVSLIMSDLRTWKSQEKFDAVILLGNSFGDLIDLNEAKTMTACMLEMLSPTGVFIMDYIGENYLQQCADTKVSCWNAQLNEMPVLDKRVPSYNAKKKIMQINVEVFSKQDEKKLVWKEYYQKMIISDNDLINFFTGLNIRLSNLGKAKDINPYYKTHESGLGMIEQSNWWLGCKKK